MKKINKGSASILIIFILGMVGVLMGISLTKTGHLESIMGRSTASSGMAYYAANSGIEDAMYRIKQDENFTVDDYCFGLKADGQFHTCSDPDVTEVTYSVTDEGIYKIIKSVGKQGIHSRKIVVKYSNATGIEDAIFADSGGIEMENNTHVDMLSGYTPGPDQPKIWSNSFINGRSKKETGVGVSEVKGSAYAVESIGCLGGGPNCGVLVYKNAHSALLKNCTINQIAYSPVEPSNVSCKHDSYIFESASSPREIPDLGLSGFEDDKDLLTALPSGDCVMDDSNGPDDCSNGTYELDNVLIDGNLTIKKVPGKIAVIKSSIWVTGNIIIEAGASVSPDPDISDFDSPLVVAEGTITTNAGVEFGNKVNPSDSSQIAFLKFISKYFSPSCDIKKDIFSIALDSNTNSVLFDAIDGCIYVKQNGTFYGSILGKQVFLDKNSTVYYDPRLNNVLGGTGEWKVVSYKEY
jgi:hypothetical protein